MNKHLTVLTLLLAARLLCAADTPAVDLYAGWSWLPYGYGWHGPYRSPYASAGWPWQPYAGILCLAMLVVKGLLIGKGKGVS